MASPGATCAFVPWHCASVPGMRTRSSAKFGSLAPLVSGLKFNSSDPAAGWWFEPLWENMISSMRRMTSHILWKIKHVPNHQPQLACPSLSQGLHTARWDDLILTSPSLPATFRMPPVGTWVTEFLVCALQNEANIAMENGWKWPFRSISPKQFDSPWFTYPLRKLWPFDRSNQSKPIPKRCGTRWASAESSRLGDSSAGPRGHHAEVPGAQWDWQKKPRWNFQSLRLEYRSIYIYIFIWVNYNISLIWIKAIWGWFPLLTMIPVRSQWGRYNLPRYIYIYIDNIYIYDNIPNGSTWFLKKLPLGIQNLHFFQWKTGWWLTYPSEKYESQWEGWHPIYYGK